MATNVKGLSHGPVLSPSAPEAYLLGWRAACLAYRREWRQGHRNGGKTWRATIDAYMEAMPGSSREEADEQAGRAVLWASVYHNAWLYDRAVDLVERI